MAGIGKAELSRSCGLWILISALATGAYAQSMVPLSGGWVRAKAPTRDVAAFDRPDTEKAAFIAQYDDGEADVGLNLGASAINEYVMLFDGIGADVSFDAVEACFASSGGEVNFRFEIVILDDDGPGGSPGTELATFAAQSTVAGGSVPVFDSHSITYTTAAGDFFVGVRWHPGVYPSIVLCVDHDSAVQPGYVRSNETGAWQTINTFQDSLYTALMIRGFFSTPGVVAESLYLPFFLVDTTSPGGTTTLYAVRNLLDTSTNVTVEIYDRAGNLQVTENLALAARDTVTRNLRDQAGLAADGDGFARGWLRLSTAGFPDGTPVLAGDYFQVDSDNDSATGEQMPRDAGLCQKASIRFLDFGAGTRFGFLVLSPQGDNPAADPPTVQVTALDEDGNTVGTANVFSANNAFELSASDFTASAFGTVILDFSNSGAGYAFAEYSAENRFSVGVGSQCE